MTSVPHRHRSVEPIRHFSKSADGRDPARTLCTRKPNGYTLIELLITLAIGAVLIAGLGGIVGQAMDTQDAIHDRNDLTQQARFAMEQMVRVVSQSRLVLLPMADKPVTVFIENIREQTYPPSPPPPGSVLATAVLAVTMPASFDLDGNGIPDADNDGDGRIDEDLPADTTYDGKPGILNIDDDGNGITDYAFSPIADDDESADFSQNEDAINGIDDDGDGIIDEDPAADNNGDGCPGVCAVDDDGDGGLDTGAAADDDEDGSSDEDWYDPVVFYLVNGTLMQRTPVPWDESGGGFVSGLDFIVESIAENVTRFRVERVPQEGDRSQIIDLTLELINPTTGEVVSLHTQVRVGGAL